MARRAEGLTEKLIECAKSEFLEKGYEHTHLQDIAEKAGSTTGAIYIRYQDKASLFTALVNEAADGLVEIVRKINEEFLNLSIDEQRGKIQDLSDSKFKVFVDYIYQHFDEFKLLLTSSGGEVYSDFIHRLVDIEVNTTSKYMKDYGNDAISKGSLTTEFAHLVSESFFTGVFQVVVHDMPRERGEAHIQRLREFFAAGWKKVLIG